VLRKIIFIGIPVALDFHITSTIGAVYPKDKGTASPGAAYATDMDGKIRGNDGSWDIGALEFTNTSTPILDAPSNVHFY
jgi:hypothetical protein